MKYFNLLILFLIFSQNLYSIPELFIDRENLFRVDTVMPFELEKKIMFYNIGDSDLIIDSLKASCGCTSFKLSKDTIAPRDSSELTLRINLTSVGGNQQYHLYFKSNEPGATKNAVTLNLFVYRDLLSNPKKLPSYFNINNGDTLTYTIALENASNEKIYINNPVVEDDTKLQIIAMLPEEKSIAPHTSKEYEIKLIIKRKGFVVSKLIIPTSSHSVPKLEYSIVTSTN
jgi:hypothetical protein